MLQRHWACHWPTTDRLWLPARDSNPHLHVQSVRSLQLNEPGPIQSLAPRAGFEQASRCLTGSRSTAELSRISATKLKTLWPIGSEGRWNPNSESPELSHRNAMPRLRGRWCKSVIGSVHHRKSNLPRNATVSQVVARKSFGPWLRERETIPLTAKRRTVKLAPVAGIEPANQCLERASAKPAWRTPAKLAATTRFKLAPYSSTGRRPILRRRSRFLCTIRTLDLSHNEGGEIDRLVAPDSTNARTTLVHVRGFEPPAPKRVEVLQTPAANRICLTCTSLAERAWI